MQIKSNWKITDNSAYKNMHTRDKMAMVRGEKKSYSGTESKEQDEEGENVIHSLKKKKTLLKIKSEEWRKQAA